MAGIQKFQTLNIVEESNTLTDSLTETQICYGPSNNNTNSTKNKTNSNNNNNQNQVKILKRNSATDQKKENNPDIKCYVTYHIPLIVVHSQNHLEMGK